MIRTQDFCSLTDFRQQAATHLQRLVETGHVEVVTVNGQARGVIMSPKTFDDLQEKASLYDSLVAIDRSMAELKAGKGKNLKDAMDEIRKQLGVAERM